MNVIIDPGFAGRILDDSREIFNQDMQRKAILPNA